MKIKRKSSIFNDFGFPILLMHAPHIVVDGEEVLKINYEKIAKKVFHAMRLNLLNLMVLKLGLFVIS